MTPQTASGKALLAGRFVRSLVCSIAEHAKCNGLAAGDPCNCPCHFQERILAIESEAAAAALDRVREAVEGLPDPVPWFEPERPFGAEPDGYFIDRAAVLAILADTKP